MNSKKDSWGHPHWDQKQPALHCEYGRLGLFYPTKLADWMKVVKTSCCHGIEVNLFKGNIERSAPEFVRHIYWISLVCLSGLYTGSSTPHHSASVELLSSTPNLASASTTDLPPRQHRLDRDLGSPHHLSPLAAMDSTREGWVFHECVNMDVFSCGNVSCFRWQWVSL